MTQVEREQAIEVLQAKIDSIEDDQAYSQLSKSMYEDGYRRIDACKAAIAALREPAHEWVRTTDRLPMVEQVVVGLCGGKVDIYQMVNIDDFKRYVEYWCALPLRAVSALQGPQPDPDTGLKGCWHCRNIEAHHIEYVIAVKAKGGTPMNTPVDCPYHYCPACGRKLEVEE